jgi:uncharacterized membrane protein YfcA
VKKRWGILISGAAAGAVNGLLGAGGGMVLVPLMTLLTDLREDEIFPASISMILPICLVSLTVNVMNTGLPWHSAFPYLIGSAAGGFAAALWGNKIPVKWLHRVLGALIIWGGIRYLC